MPTVSGIILIGRFPWRRLEPPPTLRVKRRSSCAHPDTAAASVNAITSPHVEQRVVMPIALLISLSNQLVQLLRSPWTVAFLNENPRHNRLAV